MFDVSFSELFVIGIVALLVIGPEKLPKVARTVGAFMGRMQRYVGQVKEEVNREMRFEELQKLQQEIQSQASQLQNVANNQLNDLKDSIETHLPDSEPEQATLEPFELTSPKQTSRKITQIGQRPPKPIDTPLFVDMSEVDAAKKASAKKPRATKVSAKKTTQTPVTKKVVTKKSAA